MSGCNGTYLEEHGLITDAASRLTVAAVKCGGLEDEEFERYLGELRRCDGFSARETARGNGAR